MLRRLFAINPHLVQRDLARKFEVDEETISRDMKVIRAAAGQRAEDQTAEVGETLEQIAQIVEGALGDVPRVQADSNARAAHRNTALKALEQKVNVLFRLGYWTEAAKRHLIGEDPEHPLPPGVVNLRLILADDSERDKVADLALDPEEPRAGEDEPGGPGEGGEPGTLADGAAS